MARTRDRESAKGLLPRMEARPWSNGKTITYRYHPAAPLPGQAKAKPINLGTDLHAALQKVLDLNGQSDGHGSLTWVWERYKLSKKWLRLTDGTRADYKGAWKQLAKTFGRMQA